MEREEFSALYRRYWRPMLLYALSLTGERAAAEDLTQSAFMKALLSYRGESGSFRAWLARVLRNEFLSQRRRDKFRAEAPPEAHEAADPRGGPLEALLAQEEQRRAYQAVLALPRAQREVLVQSAILGLSDAEIAALRGTTTENVRQLRHRARLAAKRQMKEGEEP